MILRLRDLVAVKQDPRCRHKDVVGGFISNVDVSHNVYEICLLDAGGSLVDCVDLELSSISLDTSKALHDAFEKYQSTVDAIAFECDERAKKYRLTQAALAKKYNLSQDEVYAIYQSLLNYENYYHSHIE